VRSIEDDEFAAVGLVLPVCRTTSKLHVVLQYRKFGGVRILHSMLSFGFNGFGFITASPSHFLIIVVFYITFIKIESTHNLPEAKKRTRNNMKIFVPLFLFVAAPPAHVSSFSLVLAVSKTASLNMVSAIPEAKTGNAPADDEVRKKY
jgi:hypothetical protein